MHDPFNLPSSWKFTGEDKDLDQAVMSGFVGGVPGPEPGPTAMPFVMVRRSEESALQFTRHLRRVSDDVSLHDVDHIVIVLDREETDPETVHRSCFIIRCAVTSGLRRVTDAGDAFFSQAFDEKGAHRIERLTMLLGGISPLLEHARRMKPPALEVV